MHSKVYHICALDTHPNTPIHTTRTRTHKYTRTHSADSVRLVTNRSPGRINSLRLCTLDDVRCGGFEAGASRGFVWANLTNTGSIAAAYTLTVRTK